MGDHLHKGGGCFEEAVIAFVLPELSGAVEEEVTMSCGESFMVLEDNIQGGGVGEGGKDYLCIGWHNGECPELVEDVVVEKKGIFDEGSDSGVHQPVGCIGVSVDGILELEEVLVSEGFFSVWGLVLGQ